MVFEWVWEGCRGVRDARGLGLHCAGAPRSPEKLRHQAAARAPLSFFSVINFLIARFLAMFLRESIPGDRMRSIFNF